MPSWIKSRAQNLEDNSVLQVVEMQWQFCAWFCYYVVNGVLESLSMFTRRWSDGNKYNPRGAIEILEKRNLGWGESGKLQLFAGLSGKRGVRCSVFSSVITVVTTPTQSIYVCSHQAELWPTCHVGPRMLYAWSSTNRDPSAFSFSQ